MCRFSSPTFLTAGVSVYSTIKYIVWYIYRVISCQYLYLYSWSHSGRVRIGCREPVTTSSVLESQCKYSLLADSPQNQYHLSRRALFLDEKSIQRSIRPRRRTSTKVKVHDHVAAEAEKMKLLTHNMLKSCCKGIKTGYPLRILVRISMP